MRFSPIACDTRNDPQGAHDPVTGGVLDDSERYRRREARYVPDCPAPVARCAAQLRAADPGIPAGADSQREW
ncbi:hypothetical protein Axi01nite_21220 [Actinoplanes xinjiangensis]|nr:hypothetical protein Axi01nite_21220 [Actinoplanes xinjiangensis]